MYAMQDGSGYGPQTRVRGAAPGVAAAKGAAAYIMRSVGSDENRLPHTGTTRYVDVEFAQCLDETADDLIPDIFAIDS